MVLDVADLGMGYATQVNWIVSYDIAIALLADSGYDFVVRDLVAKRDQCMKNVWQMAIVCEGA